MIPKLNERRQNEELRLLLEQCHWKIRSFYRELMPLMEAGKPYGWIRGSYHEIAAMRNIPIADVYQYMQALRDKGILRRPSEDIHYSPWLVRSFVVQFTVDK